MAAIVHEGVEEMLQCRNAPDADMLFCCALGRYGPCLFTNLTVSRFSAHHLAVCCQLLWSPHDMAFVMLSSYRRGKPMTGDVDMLIAPCPSCGDVDARQALHAVCDCLRNKVCPTELSTI